MSETRRGTLQGREVQLREVSIGIALAANKEGDGFRSALFVLSHSAHWADNGERVFADVDDIIDNWPMSALHDVNLLATVAGELNMGNMLDAPKATNGTGEPAAPSS